MRAEGQRGFSLLELMISAVLTVGLMGVVFLLANRNQQVFVSETGVIDMNQNIRTAADLITRDVQSAGTGLIVSNTLNNGCLAAIFYTEGGANSPDTLMIVNGDTIAPTAQVRKRISASSLFYLYPPPDVKSTDTGVSFTYADFQNNNQAVSIYRAANGDPLKRKYLVYDDDNVMMFDLANNASYVNDGGSQYIQLQYNSLTNVAGKYAALIGATVNGNQAPSVYDEKTQVAVMGTTIAYRLDTATRELMRTEDLQNWYTIARGITDFQVQYRVIRKSAGVIEEAVVSKPGVDTYASGNLSLRREIRSVIFTIAAETPDLRAADRGYKEVVQKFEVTPRNLNFSNNNSLSE